MNTHLHPHDLPAASAWVQRWTSLIRPQGSALDVACGAGRHMGYLASHGLHVTGLDRNETALQSANTFGRTVLADLENSSWPLMDGTHPCQFDAVLVTNYLWRPLFPTLIQSLAPGGVLIYETFATGNETVGKPSRPDFLLQPGELLGVCQSLRIVAYEEGFMTPPERFVQRIAAVKPMPHPLNSPSPAHYRL